MRFALHQLGLSRLLLPALLLVLAGNASATTVRIPADDDLIIGARAIVRGRVLAISCDFDPQGRILVPPSLRTYAQLEKTVVWAGMGRHAELWSKERWLRAIETTEEERMLLSAKLGELGL